MMKKVEEPSTTIRFPFERYGRSRWIRPLTLILACALIVSLVFSAVIVYRYADLAKSNNNLANDFSQLNQAYNGLNNTYSSLKKAYDELRQAYYILSGGIPFQTIQTDGGLINPAYDVIQNESALNEMWSKLSFLLVGVFPNGTIVTPSPPKINFTESTLIAIFRGACPNACGINIAGIYDVGQFVLVKVEMINPGNIVIPMVTYPSQMVTMPRTEKPILFDTVEKTV